VATAVEVAVVATAAVVEVVVGTAAVEVAADGVTNRPRLRPKLHAFQPIVFPSDVPAAY
jgi:hypothetical protein